MHAREEEVNELLSMAAKLSEVASRNRLTLARHLLDMLQLELIMVMFGYSDVADSAEAPVTASAQRARSRKRNLSRARRV